MILLYGSLTVLQAKFPNSNFWFIGMQIIYELEKSGSYKQKIKILISLNINIVVDCDKPCKKNSKSQEKWLGKVNKF